MEAREENSKEGMIMQNYPNYFQMQQPASRPFQGLKGRPVSSIDEVRGTTIDFDGSVFFFPDLANKRIYTKQINMDGTATLNVYELKNIPLINETNSNFVTREEFEQTMTQIQAVLNQIMPMAQQDNSKAKINDVASQF